jgi:hypothetical protein
MGVGCLLPPLSSGGAQVPAPSFRFHTPLIAPDGRISRIRLSDRASRLHPRRAATKLYEAYATEVPVPVREWISPAPASPRLMFASQPPASPHRGAIVERPIRGTDGAYLEVGRPTAQRPVQLAHHLYGLLPRRFSGSQRTNCLDHAPDAFLRRPHTRIGAPRRPFMHPPERVTEHLPGRPFTHWETPPLHGAHPKLPLANGRYRATQSGALVGPTRGLLVIVGAAGGRAATISRLHCACRSSSRLLVAVVAAYPGSQA